MNYSDLKKIDIANGPGVRVSLFVNGCRRHCKGCFNPETWDFDAGNPFTEDTMEDIIKALEPEYIKGFSLLGGEPFEPENQQQCLEILTRIKAVYPEKSIWCFSGYRMDRDFMGDFGKENPLTKKMLEQIDVLVDGEFMEAEKNAALRFKGSANQRTINVKESLREGKILLEF